MTAGLVGAVLVMAAVCGGVSEDVLRPRVLQSPVPQRAVEVAQDAWLGSDKFTHIAMSFATTSFAFAAASALADDAGDALVIAVPIGAVAGVGKEILDRRRGGVFSLKDLAADAIGVAVAWLMLREVN